MILPFLPDHRGTPHRLAEDLVGTAGKPRCLRHLIQDHRRNLLLGENLRHWQK
jgi:hypothetical protein